MVLISTSGGRDIQREPKPSGGREKFFSYSNAKEDVEYEVRDVVDLRACRFRSFSGSANGRLESSLEFRGLRRGGNRRGDCRWVSSGDGDL